MKTIFNFILFAIAFVVGLLFVVSFKIIGLLIGILFFAFLVGIVIFTIFKIIMQSDNDDKTKNMKFTDDTRFKNKTKEPE